MPPMLRSGLLKSTQHEAGMSGPAHPPAHDPADIGAEGPVHMVKWTWRRRECAAGPLTVTTSAALAENA